ncbi:MAG: hypothetical protein ACRD6W_14485, partial [Nitrososphaerales archaeon]
MSESITTVGAEGGRDGPPNGWRRSSSRQRNGFGSRILSHRRPGPSRLRRDRRSRPDRGDRFDPYGL